MRHSVEPIADIIDELQPNPSHLVGPINAFTEFAVQDIARSIPDRFEKQVAKYRQRVAIKTPDIQLDYHSLNQAANRLARAIVTQHGTKSEPVALLLDNGPGMITAILGTLKAGKMFVALDLTFPKRRLAYMLSDAQAGLIVTSSEHLSLAREIAQMGCEFINVDKMPSGLSAENLNLPILPGVGAYIVYTSGSTGQPKGIVHSHRNLLHNIMNYTNAFHISPDDRLTLLHSSSYSSALVDIFCALLNGAALFPWDVRHQGLVGLADWLVEQAITVFNWAPTPFRYFVETASDVASRLSLRLLVLGSEPVTKRDFELYRKHFPENCLFVNRLGTSESNNFCLYFADRQTVLEGHVVLAGYAVPGKKVLLLDNQGQEVGFDQIGQIAIQSSYLALGYWRKPELTEAVFLPDPDGGNERIYLTGDLGRMRCDGCLEHLGRKDFQVKIRGYRIETAEIETAIAALESVRDVVVVARDRLGEQRLVAYLVLTGHAPLSGDKLKRLLGETLPDYMVPDTYVTLDELPMTATGKTDRKALPDPDWNTFGTKKHYAPPGNSTEAALAEIWSGLFGGRQIGIHDDFFELGGYSLLAASLFAQIHERFGQRLPLATLLKAPTIAQLTKILTEDDWSPSWSSLVPIQPNGSKPPLFFVHAHGGNVIGYYDLAHLLGPDQPFFGLQAQGLNGHDPGFQRFEDMAAHHVQEIRTIQPHGPYFLGGWCYGGNLAKEMAHQLREQGQEVAFLAMIQSTHCDYPQYLPGVTRVQRLFYRLIDRIRMEISNFREVDSRNKWAHIAQRMNRAKIVIQVRGEKAVAALLARFNIKLDHSQAYHLEMLGERHNQLYRNYKPRPYLGPVTLFRAEKQRLGIRDDSTLGWESLIVGKLEICELPGYHIGLLSQPRVRISAQRIEAALEKAQQKYV